MHDFSERIASLSPRQKSLFESHLRNQGIDASRIRSIPRRDRYGPIPLSFSQERLWFLDCLDPGNPALNIARAYSISGPLDVKALAAALNEIVRRHEVFRMIFTTAADGQPVQVSANTSKLRFPIIDVRQLTAGQRRTEVERLIFEEGSQPFNLGVCPLVRATLLWLEQGEYILLLTIHHIVFDGRSIDVLMRELSVLYEAFRTGNPSPLPDPSIQYPDFAAWQHQLGVNAFNMQLSYWEKQLANLPKLNLPTDRLRPKIQTYRGASQFISVGKRLTEKLKVLSSRNRVTPFVTLLAAFKVLLRNYTNENDIVVGCPFLGRGSLDTEGMIGCFVNTLVLRTQLGGNPRFRDLLARVQTGVFGAHEHQDVPFEKLIEALRPMRNSGGNPFFEVMFVYNPQSSVIAPSFADLQVTPVPADTGYALYDLTVFITDSAKGLVVTFQYNIDLFEKTSINRMLTHYRVLLEGVIADPEQCLNDLSMLTLQERECLLREFSGYRAHYPHEGTIHKLFETQVDMTPDAVAVVCENVQGEGRLGPCLSYSELNAQANRLAHYLIGLGVRPGSRVGVALKPSFEMLEALLGVLKAGCTYVPLDPALPAERLEFMLADSQASVLLTMADLTPSLSGDGFRVVCLDTEAATIAHASRARPSRTASAADLAYVIYTSGSTAKPKGVAVSHLAVVNFLWSMRECPGLDREDIVLAVTTVSFDIAVLELFLPLIVGARVVLVDRATVVDGVRLSQLLAASGTTTMQATPVTWRMLIEVDWRPVGRVKALCGGDVLPFETARRLLELGVMLWNMYGPTETTVWSIVQPIRYAIGAIPVGRPIANTRIYILNPHGEPVPVGVAGELYIGGAGVAQGYLNQPELTAERFLADPFAEEAGARMYKTGDLGRWLPNGTIEFLGRNDFQVKIRGFRIELGEIEHILQQHPAVCEAVVLAREDGAGDKRLVAYHTGEGAGAEELRAHLAAALPGYMIPAAFVFLDAFPLTPNGKFDRKTLPAPQGGAYASSTYEPPLGETEETLAYIWAKLLKLERVGRRDNFFELGGHSLLVQQMISRLRQTLGLEVALADLFAHPVLADFARSLGEATCTMLPPILPADRNGRLVLSFAQQRLWFLAQMEGASEAYHIADGVRLSGELDVEALRRALDRIVARHEALRTTFAQVDGDPEQRIAAAEDSCFHLLEHDLRGCTDAEEELRWLAEREALDPFDLALGPLVRGRLVQLADNEHVLLTTMHHIVSDGWSMGLLVGELSTLYVAYRRGEADPLLPPLQVQYADYAAWQRHWIKGKRLCEQTDYWKSVLAGAPALLELPTDQPRPALQDYTGAFVEVAIDAELAGRLKNLGQRHSATLFMTLLSGWALLLARLSGQDEVVVGTPTANRGRVEVEGLIGFFVNTLALRIDFTGSPTVAGLLARVKERALTAQANQDLPFEKVVETIQPPRSLAHTPLFQAMFAWQSTPSGVLDLPGLTLSPVEYPHVSAMFDLKLSLGEADDRITGVLEYATSLFKRATVERYLDYWRTLLEGMASDDGWVVGCLPLMGEAERQRVLYEWNANKSDYLKDKCVHELFEAQAAATPEAAAVVWEDGQLAYAELNVRANGLAHYLRDQGVRTGECVAILLERSANLVVAQLAILKCGAAYVPLDPGFPGERLAFMVGDCAAKIVLTTTGIALLGLPTVTCIDIEEAMLADGKADNLDVPLESEAAAYVIYTSGSTGTPNGVVVPHRAIGCLVLNNGYVEIGSDDRVAFAANPAFDAATFEVWAPLLNGGRIVVIGQSALLDHGRFVQMLRQHTVNVLWLTVGLFNQYADLLSEEFSHLRYLLVGGDCLDPRTIARVLRHSPPQHLLNGYGPTETTTFAATYEITEVPEGARSIPIGRPIANTRIYILDAYSGPVPIGVAGELYIGGAGVARGYLNRPDLTAKRFLADPFAGKPGARMYKTGDLGRWLANGTIEFLGRLDNQIKLRGYRIELGEIEAVLGSYPGVREAVALLREDIAGDKRLVTYIVSQDNLELDTSNLMNFLKNKLPEYMVPSAFVILESLPLTPSGKVNRLALPPPDYVSSITKGAFLAPRDELERHLMTIWENVLGIQPIGVTDNFFEIGGHSLLAVMLLSQVNRVFQTNLSIATVFNSPTVAEMAELLRTQGIPTPRFSLFPIHRTGSKPPFFWMEYYTASNKNVVVKHMSKGQPIYGFHYGLGAPPGSTISFPTTIELLAAHYIEELFLVQSKGPYFLIGHSWGGLVAYEMAQQLTARKERVALLALVDTFLPGTSVKTLPFRIQFSNLMSLTPAEFIKRSIARLRQFSRKVVLFSHETTYRQDMVFAKPHIFFTEIVLPVFKDYNPKAYSGRVILFKAMPKQQQRNILKRIDPPEVEWRKLVGEGLDVHEIPGDHVSCLNGPGGVHIAHIITCAVNSLLNNEPM